MKKILLILLSLLPITAIAGGRYVDQLNAKWKKLSEAQLMKMGEYYDLHHSNDSALVCFSIVATRLRNTKTSPSQDSILARALNNMGYLYGSFYDYNKAVNILREAYQVSKRCNYTSNLAYVALKMGGIYLNCNMLYGKQLFSDEIWRQLSQAMSSGIKVRDYEVVMVSFLNMCTLYPDDPQDEKILHAISQLEGLRISDSQPLKAYSLCMALGIKSYIRHDYRGAIRWFKLLPSKIPTQHLLAKQLEDVALFPLAQAQAQSGDIGSAITTMKLLLAKAIKYKFSENETKAYALLSRYYLMNGDKRQGYIYFIQYHHKKDSTLSEREIASISKAPLLNEVDELNLQFKKEHERKQRMTIVLIAACIVIILISLYVVSLILNRRKMRALIRSLYRKNVELIQLEKQTRLEYEQLESKQEPELDKKKYQNSGLTDELSDKIAAKIKHVLNHSDEITNPHFSLNQLAELTGYSYKLVSQVINDKMQKNFKTLLNEQRVKIACERLLDTEHYGQYTIEFIGRSVGFISRSNFSVTFRAITGLSPSEFQKRAMEEPKQRHQTH